MRRKRKEKRKKDETFSKKMTKERPPFKKRIR
jgi:hypothetical protein